MTEKLQNHCKLQHSLCSVKGFGQKQNCAAGSGSKGLAPTLPVQVSRRWIKTPEVFQCVNGAQFVLIAHQDECIGYLTMMLCLPHFPSEACLRCYCLQGPRHLPALMISDSLARKQASFSLQSDCWSSAFSSSPACTSPDVHKASAWEVSYF